MLSVKPLNSKKIWENFVLDNDSGCFLQSWNWGEFHKTLGKKIFRLGFFDRKKNLKGLVLLIKQEAKRGTYLECPAGPLINWKDEKDLKAFVSLLKTIARQEKCLFARVRPPVIKTDKNWDLFKKFGFVKAPMHLHAENTWQLELNKGEEELLKQMRKSTRQSLKKAIEIGVRVEQSEGVDDVDRLYKLQLQTAKRHHFVPFKKKFLKTQFKIFLADKQVKIFKALNNDRELSIAFFIFYGKEAVYHYSASSAESRKIPASYLVLWEAIKEAKKQKKRIFNFWGIAPEGKLNHRFSGVTTFKTGFGGYRVDYLPAQDLPLSIKYWPIYLFETLRRLKRSFHL